MKPRCIETAQSLLAHAIAIEREAMERYCDLATRMSDLGNDEVANVFAALARFEGDHLEVLTRRAHGIELPPIDASEHAWLDSGVPQEGARELVFRLMTPRDAIQIALLAEHRAQAFFLRLQRLAATPALRALAQEMAAEETDHIALLQRALARLPEPVADWDALFRDDTPSAWPGAGWHGEHRYFERLLDLLEKELDVFHAAGQPNYERMLDIIYYLQHFTDELHHPREDLAFALLASRDPALELPVARLRQEHRVIAHIGEQLHQCLEQVALGSYAERAEIEALAATYLVYYRNHIAREELEILPAAARLLTPEDWLAVQGGAPAPAAVEARYTQLRRQILPQRGLS